MTRLDNYENYLKSEKWRRIATERIRIDGFKCCSCGCRGTKANPLEVHHLSYKYLGNEEHRIYQDLVTLCHICHKQLHAIMNRQTDPNGRRGWADNRTIPTVSVYTVSGEHMESKEVTHYERAEKQSNQNH